MAESNGEERLVNPLLEWLAQRRRVRCDTIILRELPWFGRRVDLTTLTCSGITTAYELKLNNNRRAIQQAGYNKLVFDRSYVVTLSEPTMENLKHARDVGVGFIVIGTDSVKVLQESPTSPVRVTLRRQLLRTIKGRMEPDV